ncbi:uncharacterized protein LOC128175139 isoform X1 [Crassostrea angulata]|uniref:uncharacterized protein LOC128175139 isoform X1 n=1 Tax=Magallana angulata TaxID=2784310 RepID=UPI0022B1727A|nr:uncharacterized protein LOC128175139 isoform X1 [Crassostrea angulata]XP_052696522.1 uncharacterized protein LOC128175139 isoform X1 [Crassostrea angulata]
MERRNNDVPVVFLLDTSSSVKGEGIAQIKEAFRSIIKGYADQPVVNHRVAVITFGREVKIVQNFSNDYNAILHLLDDIECEGPSPLGKALILAANDLFTGNQGLIGPFSIREILVIMTGGHATTTEDITMDSEIERDEKVAVLQLLGSLRKVYHIVAVPVGRDPDMCFLGSVVYSSKCGKLLNVEGTAQFARYSNNMIIASEIIGKMPTVDYSMGDVTAAVIASEGPGVTTEKDLSDIYEILTNREAYQMNYYSRDSIENDLYGEKDSKLPPIGTRVRRGLHWPYFGQDSNRSGTVIGHRPDYHNVSVEWDTSMVFPYHYDTDGNDQSSHVVVCDEPRILLQRENIAVGCLVKRGPDWKWFDQDGGEGNIGSVYRVKKDKTVHVRWPNGKKSNYRFGYEGRYDVSLWSVINDPFDETTLRRMREQHNSRKDNSKMVAANDGTRSKTNEESLVNALSSKSPRDKNKEKTQVGKNLPEKDKSAEGCKRSSPTIEYEIEALRGKNATHCNFSDKPCSWEWKTRHGKWVSFPKSENDKIQKAFDKNRKGTVLVKIDEDL